MIDKDGIMGTSCDCAHLSERNCIHNLLIECYHAEFNESVFNDEESTAFLVYNNYHGLLYLFSTSTTSDAAHHHSHKRIIVTCDLSGR